MSGFLSDLTVYQQIFFIISASSTIILIIQTILALIGIANNNDTDLGESHITGDGFEHDINIDGHSGVDIHIDNIDNIDNIDSVDIHADSAGDIHIDHDHSSINFENTSNHSGTHNYDVHGLRLFTVRGIMAFLMMGSWVGFLMSRAGVSNIIATICAFISGVISLIFMAKIMQMLMTLQEDGTTNVKNALGQIGQVYIRIPADEKGMGKVNVTVQEKLCEFDAVTEKGEIIKTGEMVYITDIRAGNVLVVEKVIDK